MKSFATVCFMAWALPALAAPGDYHSVDWFVQHRDARRAQLAWCQNNTGLARQIPSCENAAHASLHTPLALSFSPPKAPTTEPARWRAPEIYRTAQLDNCIRAEQRHQRMSAELAAACASARTR